MREKFTDDDRKHWLHRAQNTSQHCNAINFSLERKSFGESGTLLYLNFKLKMEQKRASSTAWTFFYNKHNVHLFYWS